MNKTNLLFFLFIVLLFSSCATRKDLVYLRDMEELKEYPVFQKYEAIIHRDDRLSITVSCKNPELTLPFNIPGSSNYSIVLTETSLLLYPRVMQLIMPIKDIWWM